MDCSKCTEEWRPVVGHEGWYEVSSCGRMRSLTRVVTRGLWPATYRGLILQPGMSKGYLLVALCRNGVHVWKKAHVAVLEAFAGSRPTGLCARHLDGDRLNNHATNLAWGTYQQNADDRQSHGMTTRGEHHWSAKLSESDTLAIRYAAAAGESQKSIAARYGVQQSAISKIVTGRRWSHVQKSAAPR